MSRFRWNLLAGLMVFVLAVPAVRAQQKGQNNPRIGYVYPAGGKQGSTFRVTIGGQFLEAVGDAHVSGTGVKATVIEHYKPLTGQQANSLREKAKELQDKRAAAVKDRGKGPSRTTTRPAWTPEDEKALAEIRKKLATFVKKQPNPAIAETATLQVTMAPDAEPGERELRLEGLFGLTNPLVFCVGQLPEFSKKEPKDEDERPPGKFFRNRNEQVATPPTEMSITLPATVNGQILPGGVDRFRFKARRGQRLVVAVAARALIPYLPDAVPGWFQATLSLYDAKGKELAYDDDYRFHPDPVVYFQIPKDGEYAIEIKDAIYRGREDFVYRISIGELPFVTSIFPLGGKLGEQTTVALRGWNLPLTSLTHDAQDERPGIVQLSVTKGKLVSNPVSFAVNTLPECTEQEPNDTPDNAQPVTLPIVVNGRIDKPGDSDVFRFEGHAGDDVVAEVYARRLDSPLDSVLKLTDAAGRQIAFNDDHEDKGAGLTTHHADSWLRAAVPASGTYYVHIADAQSKGGPEYTYRLRISPPMPDFALRVVPSSVNVRGGTSAALTVYALRKDGFSGEIGLTLKAPPAGFTLSGARVPAKQDQVRITLGVPPTPQDKPVNLSVEGRAKIAGQETVHPAVPAEDMMQAFAYRHLVSARELLASVAGRSMPRRAVKILSLTPVKIPAGGTTRLKVSTPTNTPMGKIRLELSDPPDGIAIKSVSPAGEGTEIVLNSDATKVQPGTKGNLILIAFLEREAPSGGKNPQKNRRRVPIGALPAVSFEIVVK